MSASNLQIINWQRMSSHSRKFHLLEIENDTVNTQAGILMSSCSEKENHKISIKKYIITKERMKHITQMF
jgi:hypothetical protein